jgi:RimJ/RimL family protein N-acetyltransferase
MKPPEIIQTERLVLRTPTLDDAEAIFSGYAQDNQVTRYLMWKPHANIEETKSFLRRCSIGWKDKTEFPWAITTKENGQFIGMIGIRVDGFKAAVGYALARAQLGARNCCRGSASNRGLGVGTTGHLSSMGLVRRGECRLRTRPGESRDAA